MRLHGGVCCLGCQSILMSVMCYQCVLLFDSTSEMEQIHLVWVFMHS